MAKRHEMARKGAWVRELIDQNKYIEAVELIDTLPLDEVESVEDLYLFADLYEKAERLNKKKEIYYIVYNRNHSRHVLNRLLRLVLRMGDMEEARELFLAYEMSGDITLDTYELRYLLAKAEGASRKVLIDILEDLKKEEYTEEWGYQLARLYEQEGMRQECIRECTDLKLWFGEGKIVDKARELKIRCEAEDWEPPKDEEIPEPEVPDIEPVTAYAAAPVEVQELAEEETEPEQLEIPEEKEATEEVLEVPEGQNEVEETLEVSEPVVVKKKEPLLAARHPVENLDDLLEEDPEDVSDRGISYRTLKGTISCLKKNKGAAHFVFAGGEERITLAVAKRLTKELNNRGHLSAHSIMKITADKLNGLELSQQTEKLLGGCMLITDAPELSKKAVQDLIDCMEQHGEQIVIMLAGAFDEMDCFLGIYPELSKKLEYKVRM
ncbi:MAG: hypothetical protein J5988_02010 [Eubacterium sp.]|nr:hypothetical protein [Eubacterium sp.]